AVADLRAAGVGCGGAIVAVISAAVYGAEPVAVDVDALLGRRRHDDQLGAGIPVDSGGRRATPREPSVEEEVERAHHAAGDPDDAAAAAAAVVLRDPLGHIAVRRGAVAALDRERAAAGEVTREDVDEAPRPSAGRDAGLSVRRAAVGLDDAVDDDHGRLEGDQ